MGAMHMGVSVVGVVGAGLMATGIAESIAASAKHAVVYEPERGALERSRERLDRSVGIPVARGKLSRQAADELLDRVVYTTRLEDLRSVDAVIEAVTEDPEIKGELFQALDDLLPDARFLASNTSSISIAELAARTRRPERVLGLHFFSPVPVMKLVEIVGALDTAPETLTAAETLMVELGKHPIRSKDRSGFIV